MTSPATIRASEFKLANHSQHRPLNVPGEHVYAEAYFEARAAEDLQK